MGYRSAGCDIPTDLVYSSFGSCEIMNMKLASPKFLIAVVVTNIWQKVIEFMP